MSTLVVDLDKRVREGPRFKAKTIAEYFTKNPLRWWKPEDQCYREQESAIRNWLSILQPKNILELGPGFGRITSLLVFTTESVTLVEINKRACCKLKRCFPEVDLIQADVNRVRLEDRKYDLVLAVELLVHIPNIFGLLCRAHKALCAGGFAIISFTPQAWYEEQRKRYRTSRGVEEAELHSSIRNLFSVSAIHRSKNGQLITCCLQKK